MLDLGNYYGVILVMVALIGGCIYLCIHFFVINNRKYKARLLELKALRERKTVKEEEPDMVGELDALKKAIKLKWEHEPKDWKESKESIGEKEAIVKEVNEVLERLERQAAERKNKIAGAKKSPPSITQKPFGGGSFVSSIRLVPYKSGSEKDDIDIGLTFQAAEPKVPYGKKPELIRVTIMGRPHLVDRVKFEEALTGLFLSGSDTQTESEKELAQKAIDEIKKELKG